MSLRKIQKSKSDLISDMRTNILELTDDLSGIASTKEEIRNLTTARFIFEQMPETMLVNHIIQHVLPHAKRITAMDINFFVKEAHNIFAGLPIDDIIRFTNRMRVDESNGGLSEDDKEAIWRYFIVLVNLAEIYKKIE